VPLSGPPSRGLTDQGLFDLDRRSPPLLTRPLAKTGSHNFGPASVTSNKKQFLRRRLNPTEIIHFPSSRRSKSTKRLQSASCVDFIALLCRSTAAGASLVLSQLHLALQVRDKVLCALIIVAKMLLPSALSCDASSNIPNTRYQSALFASPPLSPPTSSHPAITNLYSTCRALQSMLTIPSQLPSPPTVHAETPSLPFKLRLRSRKADDSSTNLTPRKKIAKRAHALPPRGINKRRRAVEDDMSRDTEDADHEEDAMEPSTPKRMRLAPEVLPLGLDRSDFHTLSLQKIEHSEGETVLESVEGVQEGESWSTEEDRLLVEMVLEKLKLTKSDWQDCARSLGKDRSSVGRRWKSLMGGGEVGLKNRPRRTKIHHTWR
jgi:hypothetical protein